MDVRENAIFLFPNGNIRFDLIWSKNLKLSVETEIWNVDQFQYAELNGDIHVFYFRQEISFLGKFCPKNQNCQLKLTFGR